MRIVGALLFVLGAAAAGASVRSSLGNRRPMDVVYALVAPLAVALAILGALLMFVPGFFE